jgi:hypothetical protein
MTIDPIPLFIEQAYTFSDEAYLSATEKWQLLYDWQQFMLSGFKKLFFTRALYRFLSRWKFTAHYNQERFWHYYFNAEATHLKEFLAELLNAHPQLSPPGSAADLKAAIRQETGRLYAPLSQVLQDLEYKHEEMMAAWHEFALNAGIQDAALPPSYIVSENTRNLLAYAAYIALKQQRPLTGLQLMFPFHHQSLLQPVLVEAAG